MKKTSILLSVLVLGLALCVSRVPSAAAADPTDAIAQTNAGTIQVEDNQNASNGSSSASQAQMKQRLGLGEPGATNEDSEADSNNGLYHRNAIFNMGGDVELRADEDAEAVVVIGGSAKIHGKVKQAVVVIGGDVEVDGSVGESVVTVMGNAHISKSAKIEGDLVVVAGKAERDPGAIIKGQIQEVDTSSILPRMEWLRSWFRHCFLKMRPLAPQVGWVWVINGLFLLFYALLAVVFPRPVQLCVEDLTRRPISTLLLGVLTHLLVPIIFAILAFTVIGLIAVPFAVAALLLGALVGKVALLEWLGTRIGGGLAGGAFQRPLLALLIGSIVISLIYMVPFLGLLVFGVLGTWGLGIAVSAAFGGMKRELPPKPEPVPGPEPSSIPVPPGFAATDAQPSPSPSAGPEAASASAPPSPSLASTVPIPDILSYRRATFWERMAAAFLDLVLVSILSVVVHGPPLAFLVALAYFAGMWAWRGTSIGGIVLGLKVVRTDGQPVSFLVAMVRALAAAFSVIVLFLGFLWIAWDREKQGWHDRIAGTVVIRLPRGTPLIML